MESNLNLGNILICWRIPWGIFGQQLNYTIRCTEPFIWLLEMFTWDSISPLLGDFVEIAFKYIFTSNLVFLWVTFLFCFICFYLILILLKSVSFLMEDRKVLLPDESVGIKRKRKWRNCKQEILSEEKVYFLLFFSDTLHTKGSFPSTLPTLCGLLPHLLSLLDLLLF